MSHHHVAVSDLPAGGEKLETSRIALVMTVLFGVGAVGLITSAVLFMMESTRGAYAFSWLFAFFFAFTLCIGSLFWVLLHNASNSGWGVAIRRIPEVIANLLPFLLVLGLPLALWPSVQDSVWEWIQIHHEFEGQGAVDHRAALHDAHPLLYAKYPYLNLWWYKLPGWIPRFFIYFGLLILGARVLLNYSLHQDRTGDVQATFSARRFSCGWLPVFAICLTFAAVDWLMALKYTWFSTMWGVYIFAGSAMSSMALIILLTTSFKKLGYLKFVNAEHYHIMGKLMHAFVIFWAYIAFSQYFLIWYANMTEETQFFIIRNTGGWRYLSIALLFLHFVVPFAILLVRAVKKSVLWISSTAGFLIGAHILDMYWLVIPMRGPRISDSVTTPHAWLLDIVAFATIVSVMAYVFLRFVSRNSLYPCGDPRLQESANLTN